MAKCVALIGAAGKMGTRLTRNLLHSEYDVLLCEKDDAATARLHEQGLRATPTEEAVRRADTIILAVPDAAIRVVSAALVPPAPAGATFLLLDPAAAAADEVARRDDLHYVVCHPCHPPLFGEAPPAGQPRDFFGGVSAPQDIVIALLQGSEEAFAEAKALCRRLFAPVAAVHRVTVEQMALLEPAMAEVVAASAAVLMGQALEEAVRAGVPREAARAFMLGHAQIPLAIVFGAIGSPFSDAAQIAVRWGTERIIRPDWQRVFEPANVRAVIHAMLHPEDAP